MDFKTYRNGHEGVEERIKAAVTRFYAERGVLPVMIVVHKGEVEEARAAAGELELRVEVQGTGGCLVPEVWLGVDCTAEAQRARGDSSLCSE